MSTDQPTEARTAYHQRWTGPDGIRRGAGPGPRRLDEAWTWPRRPTTRRGPRLKGYDEVLLRRKAYDEAVTPAKKDLHARWPARKKPMTLAVARPARPTRGDRWRQGLRRAMVRPRRPTTSGVEPRRLRRGDAQVTGCRDSRPTVSPERTSPSRLFLTDRTVGGPLGDRSQHSRRSRPHDAPLAEWEYANPGTCMNRMVPRDVLLRLAA